MDESKQTLDAAPAGNSASADEAASSVSRIRIALICGLLLLASALNYLDRQTLASASARIKGEFGLVNEQYGDIEAVFGYGFVIGSIIFGVLADLVPVRWLYPVVVISWSTVTAATALATGYQDLLWLRLLLGVFEAGHWPCGVRVVRSLTRAGGRTMGNGLLQSGTSIGAVLAPLIMLALLTDDVGSWRPAFAIVGGIGILWVSVWFSIVRSTDLAADAVQRKQATPWRVLLQRRMVVVLIIVCLINTTWQLFRAWLHLFLQEGRGYSETHTLLFNSAWFAATDVGCLGVGAVVLWLCAKGFTATRSRQIVFTACAVLCLTMLSLPLLPKGWVLLAVLLFGGAGALGMFPLYHAFTQDISGKHQGKITGIAGVTAWFLVPPTQKLFGRLVDVTGSYDMGLAAASCLPAIAAIILWIFWRDVPDESTPLEA
ncbi:L-galactonate transporter [Stieleria neptunia]|uniref:L-galactonate transporter n=1 Tax=Stieleria neptunia TaxID=2527979 RepID=A0A518HKJ0_9BACT|nr:MFS transporter [Stieleria neptunia]QDV41366.1 L-galactonate transporter [Stieleria neptunia]